MKVGIMVFDDGVGGADAVVKKYLECIDLEEIVIITCDGNELYFSELNRYKVISIGSISDNDLVNKTINKVKHILRMDSSQRVKKKMRLYANKITKIIKDEKIDIMHAHLMQAIYCLSCVNVPVKKIATIHDSHGLDGEGFKLFSYQTTKEMFSKMDCVTSAVQYFFDLFEVNNILLKNKVLIPNGVNPCEYSDRKGIKYNESLFNIVFLGGDLIVKGSDYLAEATEILQTKFNDTNICIHVLRTVSEKSDFYNYIIKHNLIKYFDFVGYVNGGKHIDYMKSADLFILPSRTEGAANTLLEAIGLGLCVVATNVGGTPEIIKNGVNGLLCNCSAEDLAEKIHSLIINEPLRMSIVHNNKTYSQHFLWKNIAEQYLETYREVFMG